MEKIPFIPPSTYLFQFINPIAEHFWSAITDMFTKQELFLNSRTNFNDPFDSRPIVKNDLSNLAIRNYCEEAFQNPFNPLRSSASIAEIMQLRSAGRMRLSSKMIEGIKNYMRTATDDYLDDGGLLSFSLTAENPLLWGHYAGSFKGICAVFKRSNSTASALSMCSKVSYVDVRPILPMSLFHEMATSRMSGMPHEDLANDIFYLSFLHKSSHWSYEREARIFYPFGALKKLPFESNELIGFVLGPKSSSDLVQRLRNEIAAAKKPVALHKSFLSDRDFRIIVPHEFKL